MTKDFRGGNQDREGQGLIPDLPTHPVPDSALCFPSFASFPPQMHGVHSDQTDFPNHTFRCGNLTVQITVQTSEAGVQDPPACTAFSP